jgi:hypothetical protein
MVNIGRVMQKARAEDKKCHATKLLAFFSKKVLL